MFVSLGQSMGQAVAQQPNLVGSQRPLSDELGQ